jgi:hypothetical protein
MPVTAMSIAPSTIITTVHVDRMVPRSVIRISISIGWSGVSICRRGVAIGNRWSIIPIGWAVDGGSKERRPYNRCSYPYSQSRTP